MALVWRRQRSAETQESASVDVRTLQAELHRATDVTVERVALVVDDRLDGVLGDMHEAIHGVTVLVRQQHAEVMGALRVLHRQNEDAHAILAKRVESLQREVKMLRSELKLAHAELDDRVRGACDYTRGALEQITIQRHFPPVAGVVRGRDAGRRSSAVTY